MFSLNRHNTGHNIHYQKEKRFDKEENQLEVARYNNDPSAESIRSADRNITIVGENDRVIIR